MGMGVTGGESVVPGEPVGSGADGGEEGDALAGAGDVEDAGEIARVADDRGGDTVRGERGDGPATDRARVLDRHQRDRDGGRRRLPAGRGVPGQGQTADRGALGRGSLGDVHRDIDTPPLHGLDEPCRAVDAEPHAAARAHLLHGRRQPWQELVGRVLGGADGDGVAVGVEQGTHGLVVDGEDAAGLLDEEPSVGGEAGTAPSRSTIARPSVFSSLRTCWLTADWLRARERAARWKPPQSAIAVRLRRATMSRTGWGMRRR